MKKYRFIEIVLNFINSPVNELKFFENPEQIAHLFLPRFLGRKIIQL